MDSDVPVGFLWHMTGTFQFLYSGGRVFQKRYYSLAHFHYKGSTFFFGIHRYFGGSSPIVHCEFTVETFGFRPITGLLTAS
jgi:hypothetical protein